MGVLPASSHFKGHSYSRMPHHHKIELGSRASKVLETRELEEGPLEFPSYPSSLLGMPTPTFPVEPEAAQGRAGGRMSELAGRQADGSTRTLAHPPPFIPLGCVWPNRQVGSPSASPP